MAVTIPTNFNQATPEPVVRVMPEQFLPKAGRAVKDSGNRHHHFWVLGIGTFFLILVIAAGAYALWVWRPNSINRSLLINNQNNAPTTTAPQLTPENNNNVASTPQGRDEERLRHMMNFQTALQQYWQINSRYPQSMDQLSGYLSPLPNDPGGAAYNYLAASDGSSYQVAFILESGGMFGQQKLIAGSFFLTPLGIQIANTSVNNQPAPSSIIPEVGDTPPVATTDSDADGLTDVEEVQYTTDINNTDSDQDGYVDGVEVRAGFNPLNPRAQTLLQGGLVESYRNVNQGYEVLYPTGWSIRALDTPLATQVTITAPNNEFFEVLVEDNPQGLSPLEWYQQQHQATSSLATVSLGNLQGVKSPDGLSIYIADGNRMYILFYSLGGVSQASFITTWQMFQQNFRLVNP